MPFISEGKFLNHAKQTITHKTPSNPLTKKGILQPKETAKGITINGANAAPVLAPMINTEILFPVSFTGNIPLPKGSYIYNQYSLGYSSDFRKTFGFSLNVGAGGFYNGDYKSLGAGISFRKQPHVNVALNAEYNKLVFPATYGSTELFLLSSRVEINFSTAIFWTSFLQYNTQRNNFNINSRLQYRFRPMSDFFLVYTDNYFTDPLFKNKNRAIVFKINYWLNL